MKITIVKLDRAVQSENITYCCGDMQGAMETENIRKPINSASKPSVLIGNRTVKFCPFCGARVEVETEEL